VVAKNEKSIDAMHQLKEQAKMMKDALLRGQLNEIGKILIMGFSKKEIWLTTFLTIALKPFTKLQKSWCNWWKN
jgi:galactokinase/mevalonate kinase-like predicted kinase